MVKTVSEDLGRKVVGNQSSDTFTLIIVEGGKVICIADLDASDKVFGEDGITGEFAIAFGNFNLLASVVVFPETVDKVGLVVEVKLPL